MIGIISDTHEQVEEIKRAAGIFKKLDVEFVVHCGDIISPGTIKLYDGLKMKFIYGNCDGERQGLKDTINKHGHEEITDTKDFKYKQKRFFVCHGHDSELLGKALKSEDYDYILTGHTHEPRELRKNNTTIINPGSLFSYANRQKTIATLDIESGEIKFIDIDKYGV